MDLKPAALDSSPFPSPVFPCQAALLCLAVDLFGMKQTQLSSSFNAKHKAFLTRLEQVESCMSAEQILATTTSDTSSAGEAGGRKFQKHKNYCYPSLSLPLFLFLLFVIVLFFLYFSLSLSLSFFASYLLPNTHDYPFSFFPSFQYLNHLSFFISFFSFFLSFFNNCLSFFPFSSSFFSLFPWFLSVSLCLYPSTYLSLSTHATIWSLSIYLPVCLII